MDTQTNGIKVLLSKSRMDAHDRGMWYVARKFSEAGFEVVVIRYGTAEEVVRTALDEDVDAVCMSFSTGGHLLHTSEVVKLFHETGMENVLILVGGIIPYNDEAKLRDMGVNGIFGPFSRIEVAINLIREHAEGKKKPEVMPVRDRSFVYHFLGKEKPIVPRA